MTIEQQREWAKKARDGTLTNFDLTSPDAPILKVPMITHLLVFRNTDSKVVWASPCRPEEIGRREIQLRNLLKYGKEFTATLEKINIG